ncbi:PD-(D/E)XK nuclease family protein [Myxosarcina sp. GI1]|uniref:PD-(D/E)XK nuclease family protein n=1 Tax=Myxosarcina sp. GI1 TaxID=1541065 RepID=UPI0005685940|nr:PD-(D/E)XK nuclease family protein [Myxosarcina sp. GI1]
MTESRLIRLSQAHLNLLEICPPKFQQVYLEQLSLLPNTQTQASLDWGKRFHLLMQQQELGLPISALLDPTMENAIASASELLGNAGSSWREAEHCRTLGWDNFLLTVIYDLLIAEDEKAIILDWKTYRQPTDPKRLANNWQTRLYLYVLAETTSYLPEQISMIYCFVNGTPQSQTFTYDRTLHQQTRQDLTFLLGNLQNNLQHHQKDTVFPHRTDCQSSCPYYQKLVASDRNSRQDELTNIAAIEEISI